MTLDSILVRHSPRKAGVTRLGVRLFNTMWPCSELRDTRAYWFEFDHAGDLIDTDVPESDDGRSAKALADDVRAWLTDDTIPEWAQ